MSRPNTTVQQRGYTLPELVVVIVVIGVVVAAMFTFVSTSVRRYVGLQGESAAFGQLAKQSQRIAQVLRGTTDVTTATADDVTVYAYFYPNDSYVSLVRYYKNTDKTKLLADVTPMTANPPIGTPITAKKQTYTIIDSFYTAPGVQTFTYLDAYGTTLALPISDLRTIKGVKISLAAPGDTIAKNSNNTITVQVSLRNRKTNL